MMPALFRSRWIGRPPAAALAAKPSVDLGSARSSAAISRLASPSIAARLRKRAGPYEYARARGR
jgi:hypothetical protein